MNSTPVRTSPQASRPALVSQHAQTIAFTCVLPDVWAVASSDPAKAPYVVRRIGAQFSCTCPSYQFCKSDPATCKHCRAVRLAADSAPEPQPQKFWCAGCARVEAMPNSIFCGGCCPPSQRPLPVHALPSNVSPLRHWSAEQMAQLQEQNDAVNQRVSAILGGGW